MYNNNPGLDRNVDLIWSGGLLLWKVFFVASAIESLSFLIGLAQIITKGFLCHLSTVPHSGIKKPVFSIEIVNGRG